MKVQRLIGTAVLALVMAACAKEISEPAASGEIHFTATIPAAGGNTKTAYTEDGTSISVAWSVNDQIALIHTGVKDVATVTAVDASGKATIEGTLTGSPADGDNITLAYPADAVDASQNLDPAARDKFYAQDGTLKFIQDNIDFRLGNGKIAVQGSNAWLKEDVTLESLIAVWKLTLQDDASTPNALAATELRLRVGGELVARAASTAKSEYYVGVAPFVSTSPGVAVEATVGADTYLYCKNGGVTLGESKYYQSTVSMASMLHTPLTLEALTDGTIVVNGPQSDMQYSKNGGTKTSMTGNTTIDVKTGDRVAFYGAGNSIDSYYGTWITGGTASVKAYGNIMSLVDETGFATATKLKTSHTFEDFFYGNSELTDASGLLLPATELAGSCYGSMFYGCTSLTAAPALPATTLTGYCYASMFEGCTSLTSAPALAATALAVDCYFKMFYGCSKLNSVTCLATDISAMDCTYNWLKDVAAAGTFTKAAGADWSGKTGASGIPSGWTVLVK